MGARSSSALAFLLTVFNVRLGYWIGNTRGGEWRRHGPTLGLAYLLGILLAVPIGIVSAYRQYSIFDQIGTFVSMVGFSVPTFFTGVLAIIVFSSGLGWFPSAC